MSRLTATRAKPRSLRAEWKTTLSDCTIALGWQPRGDLLAAAALDGPVTLFEGTTGEVKHELIGHRLGTSALHWRPDGTRLATAGQDGAVRLWDPKSGSELASLKAGAQWVEHLAWSSDGELLATAAGKFLRVWDAEGNLVREYEPQSTTVSALTWEPESRSLTVAVRGKIALFNPDKDEPVYIMEWPSNTVALSWSPDGSFLAAGGEDGVLHLWLMRTVEETEFDSYWTKLKELAWDRSSNLLATGGGPSIVVWDCSGTGPADKKPLVCRWHKPGVRALAFQGKGDVLASAGGEGRLILWRLAPYERLAVAKLDAAATCLGWSANDELVAAGTESGGLAVFRAD